MGWSENVRKGEALAAGCSAGSRLFVDGRKQSAGRGRIKQKRALAQGRWRGGVADRSG